MELMFSEYILGQYLTLIAVLKKNMKSCQIKGSLNSSYQKIVQFSETEEAAKTDCSNKRLYWKIHWVC